MKYTPVLVGAAVGAIDGEITEIHSLASHKYAHGIFKFGVLAAGAMGEMFFGWNQNVDYGMMTAASALIGARIPAVFSQKSLSAIAEYTAPARTGGNANPTIAGHVAAGCTTCAQQAAALAAPTVAASTPRQRTRAPYSSAELGTDYRQREQLPTGAG